MQFIIFIRKEFAHVLRDRKTLLILFGLPVVQILIFGFALTNEVKHSKVLVVDYAKDVASIGLTKKLAASSYFDVQYGRIPHAGLESVFIKNEIKLVVLFPAHFASDLRHNGAVPMQVITDASDPNTATTLTFYLNAVVQEFLSDANNNMTGVPLQVNTVTSMLYNPQLKGAPNFVPGVMALILMLVCVMMTAISIVREKESGTMEILLVSPFKPVFVILAKAVPYLILSLVNVASIVTLSILVLDVPVKGSMLLLFAESTLFIMTCLSLGLLISVRTETQQTAMLISLMGMLLPTLLFSGFMFPIENMPVVLQVISNVVPAKWYYLIIKDIMVKGLGFSAVWKETLILFGFTIFFLVVSLKNFKIRLA